MPVQAGAGPVVSHRGARVGVGGGFLHVAQRHPGVERRGYECMPQRVGADVIGDPGAAGDPVHDPGGAVPVQPPPVRGEEQRSFVALADGQVDRAGGARRERDGDDLAALMGDEQGPVPAFHAQVLDVGAGRLRHPQPVQRQQQDQRVLCRRAETGGDQQRAELVAVQGGSVRLVVQPGPADVRGRGMLEEFLLDRVFVEPGDGGQSPGNGRAGTAFRLEVAGEGLDVGPSDRTQGQRADAAPGGELAQVQRVRLPGQAALPGQEACQGETLGLGEDRLDGGEGGGGGRGGHRAPSGTAEAREPRASRQAPAMNEERSVSRARSPRHITVRT